MKNAIHVKNAQDVGLASSDGQLTRITITKIRLNQEVSGGFYKTSSTKGCMLRRRPSHSKHHFCFHDSNSHSIFTGDTFGISCKF